MPAKASSLRFHSQFTSHYPINPFEPNNEPEPQVGAFTLSPATTSLPHVSCLQGFHNATVKMLPPLLVESGFLIKSLSQTNAPLLHLLRVGSFSKMLTISFFSYPV